MGLIPQAQGVITPSSWDMINPTLLGVKPPAAIAAQDQALQPMPAITASLADRNGHKPWHPDNGLFWFGMLAALTFGLIGATSTVRFGPIRGQLAAGKT